MAIWYFPWYFKMCTYLFYAVAEALVGNHCTKHRYHQYIQLTGRKTWINVNGFAKRLSSMAKRMWRYILRLGIRVGRWICRYERLALMPVRIVISSKYVRIPKWSIYLLDYYSDVKFGHGFRKSHQYGSNTVFKLRTHIFVSLLDRYQA